MSDLRQLIGVPGAKVEQYVLTVFNGNYDSVTNGGACCLWTVPSGITSATFEVWGGGGDGPGACCCMWPASNGGAGGYNRRTIAVTAGCQFRLCAAGSGCCQQNCCGTCGFPSYVICSTGGATVTCATGGCGGQGRCWWFGFSCTGICELSCGVDSTHCGVGDFGQSSLRSPSMTSNFCNNLTWDIVTGAPKFRNTTRKGYDTCYNWMTISGCYRMGASAWPGGGGTGGGACGGPCCWGGWGAGGLVMVTYY